MYPKVHTPYQNAPLEDRSGSASRSGGYPCTPKITYPATKTKTHLWRIGLRVGVGREQGSSGVDWVSHRCRGYGPGVIALSSLDDRIIAIVIIIIVGACCYRRVHRNFAAAAA